MRADSLRPLQLPGRTSQLPPLPSTMPVPTLPAELIAQILDLVDSGIQGSPPYQDLFNCCLVARAFLSPARTALYRTVRVDLDLVEISDAESDEDGFFASRDLFRLESQANRLNRIVGSLSLHPHLGHLVRKLDLRVVTENMDLELPQEVLALVRYCPSVEDVSLDPRGPALVKELREMLQGVTLRRLSLQCIDFGADHDDGKQLIRLLQSQAKLEHLSFLTIRYRITLASPPCRLRSLEVEDTSLERLRFVLSPSHTTLNHLSLHLDRQGAGFDLSPFIHLTSLKLILHSLDSVSSDLNLHLCTSLRDLTLRLSDPLTSTSWPPSLQKLTIERDPLPSNLLLPFLHSPQSSHLRQIRFLTQAPRSRPSRSWPP